MSHPEGTAGSLTTVAGPLATVGVDAGASLAKIAVRGPDGALVYRLESGEALEPVAAWLARAGAERVGLTGCGAGALGDLLDRPCADRVIAVNEFAAWGRGASELLAASGAPRGERRLLVSLGTGTSVMLQDGLAVNRIGGTALGGGTVVGLGAALLGCADFTEIAALAERGSRQHVDLLVSDLYRPGQIALAGEITAASFGKLARLQGGVMPDREDVARALMGLVGENVALICAGLAAAHRVRRLVFGGSTLRKNPSLVSILQGITTALGAEVTILPDGEFAGALGALLLAETSS
jgi:type II pantothenate kinase